MKYVPPEFGPPYRVLVLVAATRGWYDAPPTERAELALPRFAAWLARWEEAGARLVSSFDDDLFMAGEPGGGEASIYLCYEVPSLDIVPALIQEVREEVDGARLDRWLRFEARVGRALFLASDSA
ncbi:MAG: hypothetical protein ACRDNC_08095 [Gaiellaceae bacterium]